MSTIASTDRLSNTKQTARPLVTLVLPIRAELRRSAVYAEIGIVTIAAARWAFLDLFPQGAGGPWGPLVPFVLIAIALLAVFRWRLRVDSTGIARRRLVRWDLWPWESFEQGKVLDAEGESASYILPEKPFWARKLRLSLLEDADQARVAAIIDRLRLRRPLELPLELAFRYGFRKDALIAPGGLLLRDRGQEVRYDWKKVETLRICRSDRHRRDFQSLEIVLPDRVVKLSLNHHQSQVIRSWSSAGGLPTPSAEVLAATLERLIPRERVRIFSLGDAPLTLEEWHDRRSTLAKKSREFTNLWRIFWVFAAFLFLVVLSDYHRGMFAVIGMAVLCAVALGVFFIVIRYIQGLHREEVAKLEAQMPKH